MKPTLQSVARDVADIFFPRSCVDCGGAVEGGGLRHVCARCETKLFLVNGPHCDTCGAPFFGEVEGNRLCEHCASLVPVFGEGKTAVLLKGPARALVHGLKYHGALFVLEDIASIMRRVAGFADYVGDAILVPVPLHPRKERERGYNQSELLAGCAVRIANGKSRVENGLRRVADTPTQTRLDRATRQANLKNAFALAPDAAINPGLRYLLIDDVFTTGATLNACAEILRRAGASRLDVVTFGHG